MTNKREWSEVDSYFTRTIVAADPALEEALAANAAAGLPSIDVSAPQGKLLHLMARMTGAKKALEIGTLGGYSTIWLASALPDDGRLITLEWSGRHAEVARRNVARAGLSAKVEVRQGAALETLPKIEAERLGPFDFVFIDADKDEQRGLSRMGAQAFKAAEPRSWSTTSCERARWPTRGAPIRTSSGCGGCST